MAKPRFNLFCGVCALLCWIGIGWVTISGPIAQRVVLGFVFTFTAVGFTLATLFERYRAWL